MTKSVTVVRCPACGSTHAGEDGGIVDLTLMRCEDCGHHEHCDHWQLKFDWNLTIALPDDAQELPRFAPPLDPRLALHTKDDADDTTPVIKSR